MCKNFKFKHCVGLLDIQSSTAVREREPESTPPPPQRPTSQMYPRNSLCKVKGNCVYFFSWFSLFDVLRTSDRAIVCNSFLLFNYYFIYFLCSLLFLCKMENSNGTTSFESFDYSKSFTRNSYLKKTYEKHKDIYQ